MYCFNSRFCSMHSHIYMHTYTHAPTMDALHQPFRTLAAYREKKHCVSLATQQDKRKTRNNEF